MEFRAAMFQSAERSFSQATEDDAKRFGATSGLQAKRILSALRDAAAIPRRRMEAAPRSVALRLMRAHSPVGRPRIASMFGFLDIEQLLDFGINGRGILFAVLTPKRCAQGGDRRAQIIDREQGEIPWQFNLLSSVEEPLSPGD
jgi:hypothetical protein